MKTFKNFILFSISLLFCLGFFTTISHAATKTVSNEQDLINAVNDSTNGDIIELSSNITLTKPLEVTGKTITIKGNGHTVTRVDTNWTPNGSNGSLITVGGDEAKLTLVNMTLTGSQKYGAQSYNGAHLVLDNVKVSNNGFGGVLVNAGTLEVKGLALGKNGTPSNNGIEIAKGSGVIGNNYPILIMNGTISSTEKDNVIYLAENDNLITFEVRNSDTTVNKVFVQGEKVVITDNNNAILYKSNENSKVTVTGSEYVEKTPDVDEPVDKEPENKPNKNPVKDPDKNHTTPKTGVENYIEFAFVSLILVIAGICYTIKLKKSNY